MLKKLLFLFLFITQFVLAQNPVTNNTTDWSVANITIDNELDYPNTIIYGPDNMLWITERKGKKVVKVSPADGTNTKTVMLDLTSVVFQSAGQDGLMGMAIHPDLYGDITTTTNNYVFLAYTYDENGIRKLRIERYTYNNSTGNLNVGSATTIIEDLNASNDHNSGKLKIGPDLKLYYTAGDNGANQFANRCNPIISQFLPTQSDINNLDYYTYQGKFLRLNLDGTIPTDNPSFNSVQSHIYTIGHRNPQGIVFGSNGKLYSSEHGPNTDDEVNIIESGKNYGWPEIAGFYDDMAYKYCNTSAISGCNTSTSCDNSSGVAEFTSGMPANFQEPIGTYDSTTSAQPTGSWLTWPTIGPSSIEIYEGGEIPDWGNSLLIPALKKGTIYRAKLNASGNAIVDVNNNNDQVDDYEEFHSGNTRFRDIIAGPDAVTFYAITDNSGGTSGPSGTQQVGTYETPGVIVKIKFIGTTLSTNSNAYQSQLNLSPNPAKDYINITSSVKMEYAIYNIFGQNMKLNGVVNTNNDANIDLSHLNDGIYLLKAFNEDYTIEKTYKILKKN